MPDNRVEGFAWQVGVWERMADVYRREIDTRFGPVIEAVLKRAALGAGRDGSRSWHGDGSGSDFGSHTGGVDRTHQSV